MLPSCPYPSGPKLSRHFCYLTNRVLLPPVQAWAVQIPFLQWLYESLRKHQVLQMSSNQLFSNSGAKLLLYIDIVCKRSKMLYPKQMMLSFVSTRTRDQRQGSYTSRELFYGFQPTRQMNAHSSYRHQRGCCPSSLRLPAPRWDT